ncbi:glycosyltransferase family 25 protein [Fulvimarina sp. MAC8]|uniref:glycosyltransferase family 25 protein n=1 Tax=Fulvimarina sp. MAC8 TaxID=3162874 RepID=UPI0032EC8673
MISAHYINLDRAKERRAFMERQADRLGLKLNRFKAISIDDFSDERFNTLSRNWERPITRVEVALLLSHASLWQRSVEMDQRLAIFEDDAVMSPRLPSFLARELPPYDLINLEYYARRKFFHRYGNEGELSYIARDKAGSAAYIVSPEGAEKLLAALQHSAAPADAFLYASGRLNITQVEPALAVQAEVLAAKGIDPGIATATQIHEPRGRLAPTANNWIYGWRRTLTQLRLVPLHVGRGTFYEFREPRVDLAEFAPDQSSS